MNREEKEEAIKTLENIKKGLYPWYPDEVLDMAIHALQQEPCEDAISRQAVNEIINDIRDCISVEGYWAIIERVKKLPPVTPQPKTGHWILLDECSNSGYYCSECLKKVVKEGWSKTVKKIKFCPNCGAKMVEPQEGSGEE